MILSLLLPGIGSQLHICYAQYELFLALFRLKTCTAYCSVGIHCIWSVHRFAFFSSTFFSSLEWRVFFVCLFVGWSLHHITNKWIHSLAFAVSFSSMNVMFGNGLLFYRKRKDEPLRMNLRDERAPKARAHARSTHSEMEMRRKDRGKAFAYAV